MFHINRSEINSTVNGFPSSWLLCSLPYEKLPKTKHTPLQLKKKRYSIIINHTYLEYIYNSCSTFVSKFSNMILLDDNRCHRVFTDCEGISQICTFYTSSDIVSLHRLLQCFPLHLFSILDYISLSLSQLSCLFTSSVLLIYV